MDSNKKCHVFGASGRLREEGGGEGERGERGERVVIVFVNVTFGGYVS